MSRRRRGVSVGWVAATLVVGAAAFWAGHTFVTPAAEPVEEPTEVGYTLGDGEVGQVQQFTAQARWVHRPAVASAVSGTVTTINVDPSGVSQSGDTVMTIDLRPVVVASGDVPAFRELARGAVGADVTQLQELLGAKGWSVAVSGTFDAATEQAVRAWQKVAGFPVDGVVHLGDLVFVPGIPGYVVADSEVVVGARVQEGDPLLSVLDHPEITVSLDATQSTLVPQQGDVVVGDADTAWTGVIAQSATVEDGSLRLTLSAADGSPICGDSCISDIPAEGSRNLPVQIVVVPTTSGVVAPVSAIATDSGGQTFLTMNDGERRSIQIVASARGMAVVTGVEAGETVLVPTSGSATS